MRWRHLSGLVMLVAAASCVPPGGAHAPAAVSADVPAPRRWVSPGTLLAAMPGASAALPAAPATLDPLVLPPQAAPFAQVAQDEVDAGRALDCLTAAVYYEARGESVDGQRAVAQVVLNRVRNPAFPASVCGVVYQGANRVTGCQFSFTCDGSLLARREPAAWERARAIAAAALQGSVYTPVGTAAFFHTTAISPWWAPSLTPVTTIGAHIFYRWPGAWGAAAAFSQSYAGVEPVPGTAPAGEAPDAGDVLRFALDDGMTVTIHRGTAGAAPAETAALATIGGVRIHRGGLQKAAATDEPPADPATPADAPADGVRVHHGAPGPDEVAAVTD